MKINKIVVAFSLLLVLLIILFLFLRNYKDYGDHSHQDVISFACQTPFLENKLWEDFKEEKTMASAKILDNHFLKCTINHWYEIEKISNKCKRSESVAFFIANEGDAERRFSLITSSIFNGSVVCHNPKISSHTCKMWIDDFQGHSDGLTYNWERNFLQELNKKNWVMAMGAYESMDRELVKKYRKTALVLCEKIA